MMTPKELAILAAKALDEKKGKEISAIEITDITTLADYFVIATGSSNTQINALCGSVEKAAGGAGREEAPPPGGLSGRHMGAAGLWLHLRPRVQCGGSRVLRSGAPVGRRQASGSQRRADARTEPAKPKKAHVSRKNRRRNGKLRDIWWLQPPLSGRMVTSELRC